MGMIAFICLITFFILCVFTRLLKCWEKLAIM